MCMTMIPSGANASRPHNCIKIESEPFFHADPHTSRLRLGRNMLPDSVLGRYQVASGVRFQVFVAVQT